jgi:streptogramin lyase
MLNVFRPLVIAAVLAPAALQAQLVPPPAATASKPGDIFISTEQGLVHWRLADGTLHRILMPSMPGTSEGMGFDASGNLYVGRWRIDTLGFSGNVVEKYDVYGQSMGNFGQGYDCDPRTTEFDAAGAAYVGESGCRGRILKFVPGQSQPAATYAPASDRGAVFWMDLAADGCTMFYTSVSRNVKRFDVCAGVQLPNFNVAPLPFLDSHDLKVLPDGGVLVSSAEAVVRLDASGAEVRRYQVPAELMWTGMDLVGDGTFWVGSYYTSNVYRFDIETGAVVAMFNTGTQPNSVVGLAVRK